MAYIHHSHTKCQDCGEKHRPGNSEECIELLKGMVADADHWRQRAEAAEADALNWKSKATNLADDFRNCADVGRRLEQDRDRLSRELEEAKMKADGYGSACEEAEREEARLEAKLAVAVKALESIEGGYVPHTIAEGDVDGHIVWDQDTARHALEAIQASDRT